MNDFSLIINDVISKINEFFLLVIDILTNPFTLLINFVDTVLGAIGNVTSFLNANLWTRDVLDYFYVQVIPQEIRSLVLLSVIVPTFLVILRKVVR